MEDFERAKVSIQFNAEDSDFPQGCLVLTPESKAEAYYLGKFAELFSSKGFQFTHSTLDGNVKMFLPLQLEDETESAS